MIKYNNTIKKIKPSVLDNFWEGWQNPPSAEKHLEILRNSEFKILAVDSKAKK